MACVTLKRSLDFDPLHSPSRANKRRRCVPMHSNCTPEKAAGGSGGGAGASAATPSPFLESPLTPEQIANNLRDEIKRLKKRRQFCGGQGQGPSSPPSSPPASPGCAPGSPEPMMDTENVNQGCKAAGQEKPIFSLRQMSLIAERMCNERVEQVRAEYDQILHQKLSEQYDAFVKFIDHQIQKRFHESQAPSYLS